MATFLKVIIDALSNGNNFPALDLMRNREVKKTLL